MKVFISWSGSRSHKVANLLSDWLCCVIQATRPWISSRDLDRGSLWFGEINDQLKDTTVGVICITQENKQRPWILFEAGALAKGLSTARVCTLLIDLEPKDVEDPLAQFNHTQPNRDGLFALVKTLNNSLGINGLDVRILEQVFDTYWPQFEEKFKICLSESESPTNPKPRRNDDILSEILETTRQLSHKIRRIENDNEMERRRDLRVGLRTGINSAMIEEIIELAKSGMPMELLLEKYRDDIPPSVLKDIIIKSKNNKDIFDKYKSKDS